MSQSEFKKRLKALMIRPENQVCSDCPERQPRWASLIVPPPGSLPGSISMGAFTCLECSGSHRRLGVHIAFVRSITLDSWKEKEVLAMENGGNKKVNAIFEANLSDPTIKPTTAASGTVRERYIRDKYERRKYYDPSVLQEYADAPPPVQGKATSKKNASRAPSEAARLRAQSKKQRQPKERSISSSRTSAPPPPARATEVDLLDFSQPLTADPGSPPNPPSAAPSPTLDMFKNMNMGNMPESTSSNMLAASNTNNMNGKRLNSSQDNKNLSSNDHILAMFNAPNPQHQMNSAFGNFGGGGGMNNSNTEMMRNSNVNHNEINMGMMNQSNMRNMNMAMMNQNHVPSNNNGMMMNNNNNMNMGTHNGNMMNSMNMGMDNMNNNFMVQQNMFANMQQQNMMGGSSGMNMNQNNMNMQARQLNNSGMNSNNMTGGTANNMNGMGGTQGNMNAMGGTQGNMNAMGGNGMNQQTYQSNSMGNGMSQNGNTGFMGGAAPSSNQQMNQFASFGAFR